MMIECPFCSTIQVPNTIFCNECGHCLLEGEGIKTNPLETAEVRWAGEIKNPLQDEERDIADCRPLAIRLRMEESEREVEVPLDKAIFVGRLDPSADVYPEIDLSSDGVLAKSVSRRHARIFKQGNIVVIEDQGSINGTFVNGRRLAPYLPETIESGDTLQLGRLRVKIQICR